MGSGMLLLRQVNTAGSNDTEWRSVTNLTKLPFRTYAFSGDFYHIVPLDARCTIGSIRHRIAKSCKYFNYDRA